MSNLIPVIEPTMVLNEDVCKSNIARMAQKAKAARVTFRPHFKTHQSREIGEWFRASGVEKITVSSLNMAMKFAEWGWNDITVAFPVNCLEHEKINYLASRIRLNLLLAHSEGAQQLALELATLPAEVLQAVSLNFHAFVNYLFTRTEFSLLTAGSAPSSSAITTGALESLYNLSADGLGNIREVEQMNLLPYLTILRKKLIESVRSLHAAGMKPVEIEQETGLPLGIVKQIIN